MAIAVEELWKENEGHSLASFLARDQCLTCASRLRAFEKDSCASESEGLKVIDPLTGPSAGSGPFCTQKAYEKFRRPFGCRMAGGPGFEPGLTGPEPVVLPLDDPPVLCNHFYYIIILIGSRTFSLIRGKNRFS